MRQNLKNGIVDLITPNEMSQMLHEHVNVSRWSKLFREQYSGVKLMKLPEIQATPSANGTLILASTPGNVSENGTLANIPGGGAQCGPESGYLWLLRRTLVTSSALSGLDYDTAAAGYYGISAAAGQAAPAAGTTIAAANGGAAVPQGVYTVNWTVDNTTAGSVNNNYGLYVGATLVNQALYPGTSTGLSNQQQTTIVVPQGGAIVLIKAISSDASGVYNGSLTLSPVGGSPGGLNQTVTQLGDMAQIVGLYGGSDFSAQQRHAIDMNDDINLGSAYYYGNKGAYLMPGEELYAVLSGVTAGNTYTLTGVALEVPFEMQGKIVA